MTTITAPSTADSIVGTCRTFGPDGPVYEVASTVSASRVHIIVAQTGEELDYPVEQALADPIAK